MLLTAVAITYYSTRHLAKRKSDPNWKETFSEDTKQRILESPPVKQALRCYQRQDSDNSLNIDIKGKPKDVDRFPSSCARTADMTVDQNITIDTNTSTISEFGELSIQSSNFLTVASSIFPSDEHDSDIPTHYDSETTDGTAFRDHVRRDWIAAVFGPEYPPTRSQHEEQTHHFHHPRQRQRQEESSSHTPSNSSQSQQGIGLAGIPAYTAYSVTIPPLQRPDEKLGITLSRLSLGVYVRDIIPSSEAWCAGVQIDSILVDINGMSLLAESSRQALERLWQYEGIFAKSSDERKSRLIIQQPTCMTFFRNGNLYKVTMLCNPPWGIKWGPCGAFALVKRAQGSGARAGVQRGAIVAAINDKTFVDNNLDHVMCAAELHQAREIHTDDIRLELCLPPSAARSGHYERLYVRKSSSTKSSGKPEKDTSTKRNKRPQLAASHDGVEIRVHPLFGKGKPKKAVAPTMHDTVAGFASRTAAGEIVAIDPATVDAAGTREFRPCPSNDRFLRNWGTIECLHFCIRHFHARFDERHLRNYAITLSCEDASPQSIRKLITSNSNRSAELVDSHMLQLLSCCREEEISRGEEMLDEKKSQPERRRPSASILSSRPIASALLHVAKSDLSLARRMELIAQSFSDLSGLLNDLRNLLEEHTSKSLTPRMMKMQTLSKPSTTSIDVSKWGQSASDHAVTSSSTQKHIIVHRQSQPKIVQQQPHQDASPNKIPTRRRILGFLRNKKNKIMKRHHEKADPATIATASSSMTVDSAFPPQHSGIVVAPQTPSRMMGTHRGRVPIRKSKPECPADLVATVESNVSNYDLYANMKSFLNEMDLICTDLVEGTLIRSVSQKIAEWALQPWTATKGTALAQLTHDLRQRLLKLEGLLPMFNPLPSCELLSGLITEECYILPSAHFPMLLTFNSQEQARVDPRSPKKNSIAGDNQSPSIFGAEKLYRTKVELVALRRKATDGEHLPSDSTRSYLCHGAVSGAVVESGASVSVTDLQHVWDTQNVLTFDTRSTWGAPQTLAIRLSESAKGSDGRDLIVSNDGNGRLQYSTEVGYSWIDLGPIWEAQLDQAKTNTQAGNTVSCFVQLWSSSDISTIDEQGEMPNACDSTSGAFELELRISTEAIPLSSGQHGRKRSLLYKHDDDLRQEMFAIQLLKTCDSILKECGLDLKLLTFACIPVDKKRGFVEWIPGSVPLSEICQSFAGSILGLQAKPETPVRHEAAREDPRSSVARAGLAKYESLHRLGKGSKGSTRATFASNPIQDFLRSVAYSPHDFNMIRRSVMETYVRSCAGYTVITYVLGVGDRHLDNLLLHQTGHFFHCDYSFILGSDPKKYLPMRITEDMVRGMGGRESDNFAMFLSLAYAAFLTLRRPENVRHLMSMIRSLETANLDDVSRNQSPETAVLGIRERLQLDLSPEEAISYIETMINESLSSKMWIAVDAIHSLGKRF